MHEQVILVMHAMSHHTYPDTCPVKEMTTTPYTSCHSCREYPDINFLENGTDMNGNHDMNSMPCMS